MPGSWLVSDRLGLTYPEDGAAPTVGIIDALRLSALAHENSTAKYGYGLISARPAAGPDYAGMVWLSTGGSVSFCNGLRWLGSDQTVVDVRDFLVPQTGAGPNSGTLSQPDLSTAFNAAVAEAVSAKLPLYLPPGTAYNFDSTIDISGLDIISSGHDPAILHTRVSGIPGFLAYGYVGAQFVRFAAAYVGAGIAGRPAPSLLLDVSGGGCDVHGCVFTGGDFCTTAAVRVRAATPSPPGGRDPAPGAGPLAYTVRSQWRFSRTTLQTQETLTGTGLVLSGEGQAFIEGLTVDGFATGIKGSAGLQSAQINDIEMRRCQTTDIEWSTEAPLNVKQWRTVHGYRMLKVNTAVTAKVSIEDADFTHNPLAANTDVWVWDGVDGSLEMQQVRINPANGIVPKVTLPTMTGKKVTVGITGVATTADTTAADGTAPSLYQVGAGGTLFKPLRYHYKLDPTTGAILLIQN